MPVQRVQRWIQDDDWPKQVRREESDFMKKWLGLTTVAFALFALTMPMLHATSPQVHEPPDYYDVTSAAVTNAPQIHEPPDYYDDVTTSVQQH
jgi:hypothetical protein